MTLRELEYIVAVARTRHFGHAAEECFVSQPTLSGQVRKLEEQLGVTLFERTNRSVALTPIGERIVQQAHLVLEQARTLERIAHSHHDPLAGPLRLGAIPTLSPYLMPLILRPLRNAYPQMELALFEEMTDRLLERLHDHTIDAALVATDDSSAEFEGWPLFDEPFWLAHPREHPFYYQETISRADLEATDLLLLSEGHCLADQAMALCHLRERHEPGALADLRASSLETILQLVGAGYGSTLVPALAMGGSWTTDNGIVARPLELPDARRRVRLLFRASFPRRAALETLARVIRTNLPNTVTVIDR
ncbi:MAG: LysR substrate-binding domain-containing protein [Pseudomonadota bacterium]